MRGLDLLRPHRLHVDAAQRGGERQAEHAEADTQSGREGHLGSCRLLRQMAHVSVTTFHDHVATAVHFFILRKGLLSSNAGSPGFAEEAAERVDGAAARPAEARPAEARPAEARAEARVVRCRFCGFCESAIRRAAIAAMGGCPDFSSSELREQKQLSPALSLFSSLPLSPSLPSPRAPPSLASGSPGARSL